MQLFETIKCNYDKWYFHYFLCKPLSKKLGTEINFTFSRIEKTEWNLCLKNKRSSQYHFFLNMQLYNEKTNKVEKQTGFIIEDKMIKIIQIDVKPEGTGKGTEVIKLFKKVMCKKGYKKIILVSDNNCSTNFWNKNDFLFHHEEAKRNYYPSSMFFNLG